VIRYLTFLRKGHVLMVVLWFGKVNSSNYFCVRSSPHLQIIQPHIKTVLWLLIVTFHMPSCINKNCHDNTLKNSGEIRMEDYILGTKNSRKNIEKFEKDMGSEKLTDAEGEVSYKSRGTSYRLPYVVTYKFDGDSVIHVKYSWSNLPGHKDEMRNCLTYLTELLEKRTGTKPKIDLDEYRASDLTTRIDFDDSYSWNRTKLTDYTAWLYFHDSGRQGESVLILEIDFEN